MDLVQFSEGEPYLFWIHVGGDVVGTLALCPMDDGLVIEELNISKPGIVDRSFLLDLESHLVSIAKRRGLNMIGVESIPYRHSRMYLREGYKPSKDEPYLYEKAID